MTCAFIHILGLLNAGNVYAIYATSGIIITCGISVGLVQLVSQWEIC